jgi:hypothetical protein
VKLDRVRHPFDAAIAALLLGESANDGTYDEPWVRRVRFHGVESLIFRGGPPDAKRSLREAALSFAAWEMRHRALLVETLAALAAAGIQPILIKGGGLAHSIYPDPALRTRADTDLLMPRDSRAVVTRVLARCGFALEPGVPSYQSTFSRTDPDGTAHSLDVHWRINNSELLSRLFTYEELLAGAEPVPPLGSAALRAGDAHSMLIACMHRATHRHNGYRVDGDEHHDPDRLIWLYDIHLLARSFDEAAWQRVTDMGRSKGLLQVMREGLERSGDFLGTAMPAQVGAALARGSAAEDPARYLAGTRARRTLMDLRAMDGWGQRARWLRDMCFPPPEYMRARSGNLAGGSLSWPYVRRAFGGIFKRIAPRKNPARGSRMLAVQIAALAVFAWIALRVFSPARVFAFVAPPARGAKSLAEAGELAGAVNATVTRVLGPDQCLVRSLVLQWLLARRDVAAQLRYGVRRDGAALIAHAWVEIDGVPVNDTPAGLQGYAVLEKTGAQ